MELINSVNLNNNTSPFVIIANLRKKNRSVRNMWYIEYFCGVLKKYCDVYIMCVLHYDFTLFG